MHYYRVNFDGSGFTPLTEGNGWHNITFSPDRKYIIDQYSRIDMAPVNELGEFLTVRLFAAWRNPTFLNS